MPKRRTRGGKKSRRKGGLNFATVDILPRLLCLFLFDI